MQIKNTQQLKALKNIKLTIEHLDITSSTRYDRRSKHKQYKYLWQINNTLKVRSQMFSLTSSERFFRKFLYPYAYRFKNDPQNFIH